MQEPIKITIVLEGGLVSAVLTAGIPVEYVTVDYDTDGADDADLVDVPQPDGINEPVAAYVSYPDEAETNGPWVMETHELRARAEPIPQEA